MSDKYSLTWRTPPRLETPLPEGITRTYVPTSKGPLELLIAHPPSDTNNKTPLKKKPILFQHGGFGSASVWIPFLSYFSQKAGFRCYAASLRGHGASWNPGFWRMVFGWGAGKRGMAEDLRDVVRFVRVCESDVGLVERGLETAKEDVEESGVEKEKEEEEEDLVLVGHSAGGGLAQYFLARGMGRVGGLVLMASFPNFGGLRVYWNWFLLDPLFLFRMLFRDFLHPRSPLSSTTLVHRAFFSPEFPRDKVREFEGHGQGGYMAEYESLAWPTGMMWPFVNVRDVLTGIVGWGSLKFRSGVREASESESKTINPRLLIMAGEKDTLMGVSLMRRMAEMYRSACVKLFGRRSGTSKTGDAGIEATRDGVAFTVVEGSGHHIQNDLNWEEAAVRIREFVERL